VILRPQAEEAVKTLEMTQIWGEEVVFKRRVVRAAAPQR
jgi:hypothetical protein